MAGQKRFAILHNITAHPANLVACLEASVLVIETYQFRVVIAIPVQYYREIMLSAITNDCSFKLGSDLQCYLTGPPRFQCKYQDHLPSIFCLSWLLNVTL